MRNSLWFYFISFSFVLIIFYLCGEPGLYNIDTRSFLKPANNIWGPGIFAIAILAIFKNFNKFW